MVVVGITGGIGSGKGLATEVFRGRGAGIIDADVIARELTQTGSPLLAEITGVFGPEILKQDGSLDRSELAEQVFRDPQALKKLNAIMHPPILSEIERRLAKMETDEKIRVVCVVAALLLEVNCRKMVDRLLVITADEQERIRRVMARDSITEKEVRLRMASQMAPEKQYQQADWVVDTSAGEEATRRKLEAIWAELNQG